MAEIGDIIHVRYSDGYKCRPAIVTGSGLLALDVTIFERTNINGSVRGMVYEGNYHYPIDCPDRAPDRLAKSISELVDGPTQRT